MYYIALPLGLTCRSKENSSLDTLIMNAADSNLLDTTEYLVGYEAEETSVSLLGGDGCSSLEMGVISNT